MPRCLLQITGIDAIKKIETFNAKPRRTQRGVKEETDSRMGLGAIGSRQAFAFCGLGNPGNFFDLLSRNAFKVGGSVAFRDHHIYSQKDIEKIESEAKLAGAEIQLTTAKDAVKLSNLKFEIPCFVVEIEMVVDESEKFVNLL